MTEQKCTTGTSSNQSAERLLKIMEFLSKQKEPVRLMDIADALDTHPSTVLRFLNSLVKTGYVEQDVITSRYYMTYKICALARWQMEKLSNWGMARPYMEKISFLFGETCCLAVERDGEVIYVEVVESPNSMIRSMQRIGNIAPLHCTGIGKLLLLNYSDKELDELTNQELKRFTQYTITTREDLDKELEEVRKTGVAYDNEECEIGARCVALPVYGSDGTIIAGISVTGPAVRLKDELIGSKLEQMKIIVRQISGKMGYTEA